MTVPVRLRTRCGHEDGQALPLGLFFLFAIAAMLFFMFNSGRATEEKLRIATAADSAAWSTALLEARALNYDAYANRAIVANQVAIAQAVSLSSWLHYFERGVTNADRLAGVAASWLYEPSAYPALAQLGAIFGGTAYLDALGGGTLRAGIALLDASLATIVDTHDHVAQALALSQSVLHASLAGGHAQQRLANDLVRKIDPALTAELVPGSHGFDFFTRSMGRSGDGRARLADVVLRSRDRYTRERSWSLRGPTIRPLQKNVALKRRGGTDLIDYDEWRALDTLEHQGQRWRRVSWRWRRTPIAWGGAAATSDEPIPERGFHGASYRDNPRTTLWYAEPELHSGDKVGAGFSGLPAVRELADLQRNDEHRTGLSLRVFKPRAALRISGGSSRVQPGGRLRRFDASPPGNEMAALARAEVFFDRPLARSDGRKERASLYSPYWQVRLVSPGPDDRVWSASRQQGIGLP
jgi:hypothetical protein